VGKYASVLYPGQTDYSEHDHDAFLNIFNKNANQNPRFVDKLRRTKRIAKVFFVVLSWLKEKIQLVLNQYGK
jgi:hypothetical protein